MWPRTARRDLAEAIGRHWLWRTLAWNDIRQRYAGSGLGSLWITANIGLMVGCLTLIFAERLGAQQGRYAAYVAIGLVLWQFIQATVNEACTVFVAAAESMRNAAMPLSVHILRLAWRNLMVLAHTVIVIPVVLIAFRIVPSSLVWTVIPAFAVLLITLFWLVFLLAMLGARFRDVGQAVSNVMQLLFFVTPIFWLPEVLPVARRALVDYNPLFALIDIVRAPLLGEAVAAHSWPTAIALMLAATAAGSFALGQFRDRLIYWV